MRTVRSERENNGALDMVNQFDFPIRETRAWIDKKSMQNTSAFWKCIISINSTNWRKRLWKRFSILVINFIQDLKIPVFVGKNSKNFVELVEKKQFYPVSRWTSESFMDSRIQFRRLDFLPIKYHELTRYEQDGWFRWIILDKAVPWISRSALHVSRHCSFFLRITSLSRTATNNSVAISVADFMIAT